MPAKFPRGGGGAGPFLARSLMGNHCADMKTFIKNVRQGAHPSGKSQENLVFLQGQGKVREFCKMVREIRNSSKVREKSGNFKIMFG